MKLDKILCVNLIAMQANDIQTTQRTTPHHDMMHFTIV